MRGCSRSFSIFLQRNFLLIIYLTYAPLCLGAATVNDLDSLFQNKIFAIDHRYRPIINQSAPISIDLDVFLLSLVTVDEIHQEFSLNLLLNIRWKDEIRTWTPADYGGITHVYVKPLDIWRPRLYVQNSVTERDMFGDDYAPLLVMHTGMVTWRPGGIFRVSCPMRMTYFPFDSQYCTVDFVPEGDNRTFILGARSITVQFDEFITNGEWDIIQSRTESLNESITRASFLLDIRRKAAYKVLNILIPVKIISFLSTLVFLTPVDSGERMSFSITVLLALSFYFGEVSRSLPTNSESLPLVVVFFACLLVHSSLAIVANLIVLMTYHHTNNNNLPNPDHIGDPNSNSFDLDGQFISVSENSDFDGTRLNLVKQQPEHKKNDDITKNRKRAIKHGRRYGLLGHNNRMCDMFSNLLQRLGLKDAEGKAKGYFATLKSAILLHLNPLDFVLFVLFSVTWLVICCVFFTRIWQGDDGVDTE